MSKQTLFIVSIFICTSVGCLITNCPRGGKRRDLSLPLLPNLFKKCTSCGPKLQGNCFGPNICCGSTIGCYIGTPETHNCRGENLFFNPCIAGFAMCRDNTGRCAANNICCNQESCHIDPTCRLEEDYTNELKIGQEYSRNIAENDS
ncbi:hypothetical protein PV327_000869 [Microctonus hyperodae]|uniref:Uncharacterized protein n=1 Tax=Microctonus hyperodae TaxID=165561 RepID=A0AA39L2D7_MICHY|nr:hypothetical protein PV327_000869 [Microctonus hyperodae]